MEALLALVAKYKILAGIVGVVTSAYAWYKSVESEIYQILAEVEKAAKDGTISKEERFDIAMLAIKLLMQKKSIKINFFSNMIIKFVINKASSNLKEWNVSKEITDTISDIIKNKNEVK